MDPFPHVLVKPLNTIEKKKEEDDEGDGDGNDNKGMKLWYKFLMKIHLGYNGGTTLLLIYGVTVQ